MIFLEDLLKTTSLPELPEAAATNVKSFVQDLIDGAMMPEDFTTKIQYQLNSSPQPRLVPFLKVSIQYNTSHTRKI